MIVGSQAIGKTALLKALRRVEGYTQKQYKTWAQRQGIEDGRNGQHLSTVGVDISDLVIKRRPISHRKRTNSTTDNLSKETFCEEVVFKTWDFAGQREYYATHQYFLTRRALYLVLWNMNDQERGLKPVNEWLVNIQSRAPNALVIIVGTHLDSLSLTREMKQPYLNEMQKEISRRFIDLMEPSSMGLPRVCAQFQVSCTKDTNIRELANCLHRLANDMIVPGTRSTKMIGVEIPSIYLELETVISDLVSQMKSKGQDPVLTREQFSSMAQTQLREQFSRCFTDQGELDQASSFLHEVGTILHYNDMHLRDLYFLDPQWLCDLLASVITTTELNKWVKSGFMELSSLSWIFHNWSAHPGQLKELMITLLCKFELAVLIDESNALLPSLLPTEFEYVLKKDHVVRRIRLKDDQSSKLSLTLTLRQSTRNNSKRRQSDCIGPSLESPKPQCHFWTPLPRDTISRSNRSYSETRGPDRVPFRGIAIDNKQIHKRSPSEQGSNRPPKMRSSEEIFSNPDEEITRLYGMTYVPSGFWPRLLTKLLGDVTIAGIVRRIYPQDCGTSGIQDSNGQSYWIPWRTGLELYVQDCLVISVKEIQSDVENRVNYSHLQFKARSESKWLNLCGFQSLSLIEVYLPSYTIFRQKGDGQECVIALKPRRQALVQLLTQVVEHIDSLLEDWYPDLGTRFYQTTEGRYLISRLILCSHCIAYHIASSAWNRYSCDTQDWSQVEIIDGTPQVVRNVDVARRNSLDVLSTEVESYENIDTCDNPDVICEADEKHHCLQSESTCLLRKHSNSALRRKPAIRIKVDPDFVYCIMVEEYIRILLAEKSKFEPICCSNHMGKQFPAPDLKFEDLNPILQATPCQVQIKSFIGRGSFGSVFKGILQRDQERLDVALKVFVPMDPGSDCKDEDILLYREETRRWKNNAIESACRAHQQVRQELNILNRLSGLPHLLQCFGVLRGWPLSLLLPLAPLGSLDTHLAAYQKTGNRVARPILTQVIQQISAAIQSLHSLKIIYRDLKAENLLVWSFPAPPSGGRNSSSLDSPFLPLSRKSSRVSDLQGGGHNTLTQTVHIALADYGISRAAVAEGYRGFAGTNGYIAPEILEFKGEQTYSDKVDIYSFGMLLYELLALRMPFEDCRSARLNLSRHVMAGGRPTITEKDVNYPCCMLDLMSLCWDQNPKQRPSAEDINRISHKPAFDRVKSVFRVDQLNVISCAIVDRQDKCALWLGGTYSPNQRELESTAGRLCVLRIRDGEVCSLRVIHEWTAANLPSDAHLPEIDDEDVPDQCCQLDGPITEPQMLAQSSESSANIYAALSSGELNVYSCIDYQLLSVLRIFPHFSDSCLSLVNLSDPGGLLIVLECGGVKYIRPDSSHSVDDVQIVDIPVVANVFSAIAVPVKRQIWFGHKEAALSAYSVSSQYLANFVKLSYWKHNCLTTSQGTGQEVTAFVQYDAYNEAVWSYPYPGNSLYCWCISTREKIRTIILVEPSKETLSLTVPLGQITYLTMMGSRMLLGTTSGQFVVVDTRSQHPPSSTLHSNMPTRKISTSASPALITSSSSSVQYLAQSHRGGEPHVNFIGYVTQDSEGNEYIITIGFGYRNPLAKLLKTFPNQKHLNKLTKRQPFIISWYCNEWFA